ncbi:uncharacterized SAM-binding protein YcdF (DUF218 family) [Flavobacterium sp. CG_9.1]|uniref:ElyC/SanA/YdcF family protein n=1 Tax=Flavobacterium sp. CG_9.1 TaxID=2787728 RepID=UPI0018CAE4C7|nr:ElyC/SanA/YdcF family protein [Flavobacterium sp. CG_9.1]MBG6062321.1 uncharacterized SAM-binding protein YcdF (DUF218 family) [Flavobacterium sp. CG_9.1]
MSSNTVDDAVKAKEILPDGLGSIEIITSDYHLERVKIIFDQVLINIQKSYFGVRHTLCESKKEDLLNHERKALNEIKKNGLYF